MGGVWRRRARKVLFAVAAILLFVLALELIKAGAKELGPFVTERLHVTTPANALGFGWILAAIVLSGSPVAAVALAFFAGRVIDDVQALLMITGSRLGASLVILGLSLFYHFRGERKHTSLEVGVLAVLVTFTIYLPAAVVGWGILSSGALEAVSFASGGGLFDFLDVVYGPVVDAAVHYLPRLAVAGAGVGVLVLSIQLFDKALPEVAHLGHRTRAMVERVFRPSVMLGVGALVTTFTLSVSVSLGLLVPLAARGYIRRENLIPYIMGANITTFIDTLFASLLVDDPRAFTIVLAEILSVAAVTFTILLLFYHRYEHVLLALLDRVLASRAALVALVLVTVLSPIALMLL